MSLLDIQLTIDTPLFSGSWKPDRIDTVTPLRPSTIKGIWRWWARAYAAGVLFDKGIIGEKFDERDSNTISKIIGRDIGLGYADPWGNKSCASSYILEIETISSITPLKATKDNSLGIQRIELLTRRKDVEIDYLTGASFNLRLSLRSSCQRIEENKERAAIGSLLTALILSGFGKGSRRGLGCVNFKITGGIKADYYMRINAVEANSVKWLIDDTRKAFSELIKGYGDPGNELPPIPLISDKIIDRHSGLKIFQIYSLTSTKNILNEAHNFFVTTRRQQVLGIDSFRYNYIGWVLGLSKKQKQKHKQTGNFITNGYGIIDGEITSTMIIGRGAKPQNFHIDRDSIISAFNNANFVRQEVFETLLESSSSKDLLNIFNNVRKYIEEVVDG